MKEAIGILGRGKIASRLLGAGGGSSDCEIRLLPDDASSRTATRADVIVIDPGQEEVEVALESLRPFLREGMSVVWSGSGIDLGYLRAAVGDGPYLFQALASPGCGDGKGTTLLCPGPGTPDSSLTAVLRLLEHTGTVEVVSGDIFAAASAVTVTGMGFLATALEGMEEGATQTGLPRSAARAFVRQTALTTARLLREHAGSPADLKDQVSSPGGTTIAGLTVLEERAVRGAYVRAVLAASGKDPEAGDTGEPAVVE